MTITELEQVIRDYILDIYKKEYIGKMEIQKLDPVGYHISLGMQVRPLIMHAELDDQKFLKFLKRELIDKRFNLVHYETLQLTYPINKSCNDKG